MNRRRVFRCAGLLTLLVAFFYGSVTAQDAPRPRKVAVFGSSVAHGSGDHQDRGGYAGRLGEVLAERGWEFVNVSRGGDNTIKIAPRFEADLLPVKAGYVVIGLSLANEGISRQPDTAHRDAIYEQWRTGMLALIQRCRDAGMRVVVGNCYAKDAFTGNPELYAYTRRMNVEISRWDVPSINFLGAIDDGTGNWVQHFAADGGHPNGAGHQEMFYAIVPSLFEAIEAGKPIPVKATGTRCVRVAEGPDLPAALTFRPDDPMHAFATSFWVRPWSNGILAGVSGMDVAARMEEGERGGRKYKAEMLERGELYVTATLAHQDGRIVYTTSRGAEAPGPLAADTEWHHVVVSHWCARGVTELYVDGVLAATVPERMVPRTFYLGGGASRGGAARADLKDWCVYRSSLNPDAVQFIHEGNLFQSSLEVYAPLQDETFTTDRNIENCAQSMSRVKVENGKGTVSVPVKLTPRERAHVEEIREGSPKPCYLFCFSEGPEGMTQIRTEFHLDYLDEMQPLVRDSGISPSPEALRWAEKTDEPETELVGLVDGRRIMRITYPSDGLYGRQIGCVMLAAEVEPDSWWFAPFFVAEPEIFSGRVVSGRDIASGYIATVRYDGSGMFRTHYVFDLRTKHPKYVTRVDAGRVRRHEFDAEVKYQEALKSLEAEERLFKGILGDAPESDSSKEASEGDDE
ncbi:MAG: hypothetical protein GY851_34205 [bacterium]|nr:hypothetical protein [bacterium]